MGGAIGSPVAFLDGILKEFTGKMELLAVAFVIYMLLRLFRII